MRALKNMESHCILVYLQVLFTECTPEMRGNARTYTTCYWCSSTNHNSIPRRIDALQDLREGGGLVNLVVGVFWVGKLE